MVGQGRSNPMVNSSNLNFYLARVEQARAEADAATLDHVRERCRRSGQSGTVPADADSGRKKKGGRTAGMKHETIFEAKDGQ